MRVTPIARQWSARWFAGGFVWSAPLEVVVESAGRSSSTPVPDVTRRVQLALLAAGLAGALLTRLASGTPDRKRR